MVKRFFFTSVAIIAFMQVMGQVYPKQVIAGDYPDPTIVRDGHDYYMTHSHSYDSPGLLIWHSQDLINWEPICRAGKEDIGILAAPELVKYKGRFYIYYPCKSSIWVIYADHIMGPWSKPIDINVKKSADFSANARGGKYLIDPGFVADAEGRRYLYFNSGWVVALSDDGLSAVGDMKKVYDGWPIPKGWHEEDEYLESPKLLLHNGYYYMISAEAGTAGIPTSHMAVVARSKSVLGPWENSPYNPLVHTYSDNDIWWSKGHGTVIDDVNGNWWIVYHAYPNGFHTLGRCTLVEPVEWTSDGWLKTKSDNPAIEPLRQVKNNGMKLSDDFRGKELGVQWSFWNEYALQSLTLGNGMMTVEGKGSSPVDGRLLLVNPTDKNYITQVDITVGHNNEAGLLLYYNNKAFAGAMSDGKSFTIYKDADHKLTVKSSMGRRFVMRIHNQGNNVSIYVSHDGNSWSQLAGDIQVSKMNHNTYGGFYALRVALFSAGSGKATFQHFTYKNGVPTEKDMSAYLLVFHKDEDHGLHMAISRDGYTFTALNEGKSVIAGDTIAEQKGIRDPHIFRGPDGAFYLSMTDLHIYAKAAGYRSSEWERDGKEYGWGNNRGLVLMKSWDLIHWKRHEIRFDSLSAGLKDIGCVWAPEVAYNDRTGKLMLYFTMRFKCEANKLYYCYVNDDFDKVETLPCILYEYPNENVSAIDGDITKYNGKYHLFYVAHDAKSGIKQAVSNRMDGGYDFDPRFYDFEPRACEAPNVWKRIGEDKWVLMYDVFSIKPHNFGFSETSDFVSFKNLGHFNEGVMKTTNFTSPKHGAVIQLTNEELHRLTEYWKDKATE
jgi:beta-xylosidase